MFTTFVIVLTVNRFININLCVIMIVIVRVDCTIGAKQSYLRMKHMLHHFETVNMFYTVSRLQRVRRCKSGCSLQLKRNLLVVAEIIELHKQVT